MRVIDEDVLASILEDQQTKLEKCTIRPELVIQLINSLANFFTYSERKINSYELALWITSMSHYVKKRGKSETRPYKEGQILNVDLGNNNYGHEFSFFHPCVVLLDKSSKLFVVPCTSQIKGDAHKYLIGDKIDGFYKPTRLLIDEARFIDKTRVISSLGKVTNSFLKKVRNELFCFLFRGKSHYIEKLEGLLEQCKDELEAKDAEIAKLKSRLEVATTTYSFDKDAK